MWNIIILFFKDFSHCDLYPYESQQSFALKTEIGNQNDKVGFTFNVV
jgi:hypothetical protein